MSTPRVHVCVPRPGSGSQNQRFLGWWPIAGEPSSHQQQSVVRRVHAQRSPEVTPLQVLTAWRIKKRWRWTDVVWTTRVLHSVCINVKGVGFKRCQNRQSHKTRRNQMWCVRPMGPNRTCCHSDCRHGHRFTQRFKIVRNETKARWCRSWTDTAALGTEVLPFNGESQWAF